MNADQRSIHTLGAGIRLQEASIALIGAGQMGSAIVRRLVGQGIRPTVVVRRPDLLDQWPQNVDATTDLPAAAASADVLICVVYDDGQLQDVLFAESGVLASIRSGATAIIHTTADPQTILQADAIAYQRGASLIDAPISGTADDIANGCLTVLLGGEPAAIGMVNPLLSLYGDPLVHVGPAGAASSVKLVNNALLAANLMLAADALRVTSMMNIDPVVATAALCACSGSSVALERIGRYGTFDAMVQRIAPYVRKDVQLMLASMESARIDGGTLARVAGSFVQLIDDCEA